MSGPSSSTPLLPGRLGLSGFPNPPLLWRTGALFVAVGMIAGAFGSHGLRGRPGITNEKVSAWATAAHYTIFNGLGLLLISYHPRFAVHRFAGPAIAIGGFVFSSSIMALILARDRFKALGPITPIGGAAMIAGCLYAVPELMTSSNADLFLANRYLSLVF
ncbi:hypothetical protein EW146_g5260 [Bondarzewia mesenterica]|uniref:DUF423-domain-containing protein n=1 Tax=Bondarzewia mesenterica TaxID=1095465 RepID=A0A4S4LS52_9AGAM|nr:hypothetical protein EW146_g5260 [Bondarzewia mesenterica]